MDKGRRPGGKRLIVFRAFPNLYTSSYLPALCLAMARILFVAALSSLLASLVLAAPTSEDGTSSPVPNATHEGHVGTFAMPTSAFLILRLVGNLLRSWWYGRCLWLQRQRQRPRCGHLPLDLWFGRILQPSMHIIHGKSAYLTHRSVVDSNQEQRERQNTVWEDSRRV